MAGPTAIMGAWGARMADHHQQPTHIQTTHFLALLNALGYLSLIVG